MIPDSPILVREDGLVDKVAGFILGLSDDRLREFRRILNELSDDLLPKVRGPLLERQEEFLKDCCFQTFSVYIVSLSNVVRPKSELHLKFASRSGLLVIGSACH